jgi:hypothetical protein
LVTLASHEPLDEAALDALLPFVALEGYAGLLDVLASSRNRTTRRRLLDRLSRAPFDIGSLVANRIEHADQWYVRRNLLLLLGRLPALPSGFSASRWAADADPRVRYEAVRLQLDQSDERDAAIRTAFNDTDARILRLGLAALQPECPAKLIPFVTAVAHGAQVPDELRVLAVQVLAGSRHASALEALLPLVSGGRNLFGRQRLAPKSLVVVAALRGLAVGWRTESRAASLVKLAAASPDDDLRGAVAGGA